MNEMNKKQKINSKRLQVASVRVSKLGFVFSAIYASTTLVFKLWKLITPEILIQRWVISLLVFSITLALWWYSRSRNLSPTYYKGIILIQIIMYLAIGSYSIYSERGMASNSIILFTIPLIIIALEFSTKALFATATLCSIVYATSAIQYFKNFPSEGYKVELYGGIAFYVSILFLISALLWVLITSKTTSK